MDYTQNIEIENDGGIYYLCKWIDFETFQTEIQNLIPIV
jgi:predicted transcriptional regulator